MYKFTTLMTILSFFLTSCCSMMCDPTRQVMVTAQQSNTEVFIDGYACGTTPLLVDLDKSRNHRIAVGKPGYQSQQVFLKSRHTAWWATNLMTPFAGAAIGTGVGLLFFGTDGYIIPLCLVGTGIGAAVGLGLGVIGTAADIYLKSDCDLDTKRVHFNLKPVN